MTEQLKNPPKKNDKADQGTALINALKAPFDPRVIHWRVGATSQDKKSGIALAYLNARDVMKRLDDVCGLHWQCDYPFEGCCRIGIKIDDEWIWKANGAGASDIEAEKGQFSDAFKRAAVLWGIGRYLYYLPNEWVAIQPAGRSYKLSHMPKLPVWAFPEHLKPAKPETNSQNNQHEEAQQ